MPGDTPIPVSRCSLGAAVPPMVSTSSVLLIKLAFDQARERLNGGGGVRPGRGNLDDGARGGGKHHQPHDRAARNGGAVFADRHLRLELRGHFDKAGRGARVQSLLVADLHETAGGQLAVRSGGQSRNMRLRVHRRASARIWEATLMYLRPASCAPRTVRSRLSVWRRLASLISIGRLTPAMTSTLPRSITEIARLDGVPPNISVSSTAPSPVSTSRIECRMSCRRCSMSSSGPMQTAATWLCGPTTCSSAATNSAASRPCVTKTMPIIDIPSLSADAGVLRPPRQSVRHLSIPPQPPQRRCRRGCRSGLSSQNRDCCYAGQRPCAALAGTGTGRGPATAWGFAGLV